MPATNEKNMNADKFSMPTISSIRRVRQIRDAPRTTFLLASFLGLTLLLGSFGCAPSASPGDGKQSGSASATDIPEITDEKLRQEINDAYLRAVPEDTGTGEPISWRFDEDEPKEFTVVEKQLNGDRAIIVLDIKIQSAPGARSPKYLTGQIRTKWELQTGWALRTWEIVEAENISMKYKNLPKPPATNSDR